MASHMRRGGGQQEMSPEDIFNAFFGGGMPGGVNMAGGGMPGGLHFYSSGFGPGGGIHFRSGGGGQGRRPRGPGQAQPQQTDHHAGFGMLFQMLPILIFILLSFLSTNDHSASSATSKGEGQYFSLDVRCSCHIDFNKFHGICILLTCCSAITICTRIISLPLRVSHRLPIQWQHA